MFFHFSFAFFYNEDSFFKQLLLILHLAREGDTGKQFKIDQTTETSQTGKGSLQLPLQLPPALPPPSYVIHFSPQVR
jgi:hypothetical protein